MLPALLVMLAGLAWVDPPPDAALLAEWERVAADPRQLAPDRAAAAAEAMRLRARLLVQAPPESLEAPTWALDQAAAQLAEAGAHGADLAVLFGLPTESQRQTVLRAASEARRLVGEAENRIERLLQRAGGESGLASQVNRERAEALRRLRDDEAGLRAPYYRGRATLLLAAVAREAGDGSEAAGRAREALEAVSLTEALDPVAETARQVTGAVAALIAGEPDAAADILSRIVRPGAAPPGDDEIDASTHAEALLALAAIRARKEGAAAAAAWLLAQLEGPPFRRAAAGEQALASDPLLIGAAHDAAARLLVEAKEPDPHAAVAVVMRLLDRDDLGLSADQRRMLVAARVDHLMGVGDVTGFAPEALALRALHAAGDPDRRLEAIALLRRAADQTGDAELRELARFEGAALLLVPEADDAERAIGVDLLISMLQELDDWPRAAEAAGAATAHARALFAADPGAADRRALLERALRAAVGALPEHRAASQWRLDLARLLVVPPAVSTGDARPEDDRLAEALALLERVDPTSDVGPPARELAEALHLEAIRAARAVGPVLAEAAARRALLWARNHRSTLEPRARLELAEILLEQGAGSEAKAQLLAIADAAGALPGGRARVRLNLARARLQTGGDAEAFADLVELAQSLDAPPPGSGEPAARPDAFWEAWALILEILARQNEAGSRDQTIRAHILRLRAVDPALGGRPWEDRILAVEARLSR